MKNEEGKVIILVCEGKADKEAFKIFPLYLDWLEESRSQKPVIEIFYTNGDRLTCLKPDSSEGYQKRDCLKLISTTIQKDLIKLCMSRSLTLQDIDRVVFFTDMDGVYIGNDCVYDGNDSACDPYYDDEIIYTTKRSGIIYRNRRKRENIEYLLESMSIRLSIPGEARNVPFDLYYVSCNLDHVMVNERNNYEKISPSRVWRNSIAQHMSSDYIYKYFEDLLPSESNYEKSWNYITEKKTSKSLSRCSNAKVFLDYLKYQASKEK